jgi:hypothetical protein
MYRLVRERFENLGSEKGTLHTNAFDETSKLSTAHSNDGSSPQKQLGLNNFPWPLFFSIAYTLLQILNNTLAL